MVSTLQQSTAGGALWKQRGILQLLCPTPMCTIGRQGAAWMAQIQDRLLVCACRNLRSYHDLHGVENGDFDAQWILDSFYDSFENANIRMPRVKRILGLSRDGEQSLCSYSAMACCECKEPRMAKSEAGLRSWKWCCNTFEGVGRARSSFNTTIPASSAVTRTDKRWWTQTDNTRQGPMSPRQRCSNDKTYLATCL